TVQGSHTYAEESAADHAGSNPYQITVTISHESAPTATASSTETHTAAVEVASNIVFGTATESTSSGLQTVATFTDPGGAEVVGDYSAITNWGHRTPATTLFPYTTLFRSTVQGSHTYAEESAADHAGSNPYQITVTISHESAPTATAS